MAKEDIPNWFVWTTTGGLALALVLLWLNYSALTNVNTTTYAMMQSNANMNMMNGGMMRMMASSMMRNNMMTSEEFQKVDTLYDSENEMNDYMNTMMNDGSVDAAEYNQMMQNSADTRNMMGGMMR